MIVGRILGWVLIACAIIVLGIEIVQYFQTGTYRVTVSGKLWFDLDRSSLNLAQAILQRYVHPLVWDAGLAPLLQLPAWAVLGVPGILLAWLCRSRRERDITADV